MLYVCQSIAYDGMPHARRSDDLEAALNTL